jgi:hypothetical protein
LGSSGDFRATLGILPQTKRNRMLTDRDIGAILPVTGLARNSGRYRS